jgi:hypothetical protein
MAQSVADDAREQRSAQRPAFPSFFDWVQQQVTSGVTDPSKMSRNLYYSLRNADGDAAGRAEEEFRKTCGSTSTLRRAKRCTFRLARSTRQRPRRKLAGAARCRRSTPPLSLSLCLSHLPRIFTDTPAARGKLKLKRGETDRKMMIPGAVLRGSKECRPS